MRIFKIISFKQCIKKISSPKLCDTYKIKLHIINFMIYLN